MNNKIDTKEITNLVQAFALGCISPEELRRLRQIFQTENDIPWAELGIYQNMLALLPAISSLDKPDSKIKENLFKKISESHIKNIEQEFNETGYEEVNIIKTPQVPPKKEPIPAIEDDLHFVKVSNPSSVEPENPLYEQEVNTNQNGSNDFIQEEKQPVKWMPIIALLLSIIALSASIGVYFIFNKEIATIKEEQAKSKIASSSANIEAELNRNGILKEINLLLENAKNYYKTPAYNKGGDDSFMGYNLPPEFVNSHEGTYVIERTDKEILIVEATGIRIGEDNLKPIKYSCTLDSSGKIEINKLN